MLVDVGDALLGDPMYDLVSCMRKRSECAAHRIRHRAACSTQHTPCNSHERRLRRSDCDRMRSAATGRRGRWRCTSPLCIATWHCCASSSRSTVDRGRTVVLSSTLLRRRAADSLAIPTRLSCGPCPPSDMRWYSQYTAGVPSHSTGAPGTEQGSHAGSSSPTRVQVRCDVLHTAAPAGCDAKRVPVSARDDAVHNLGRSGGAAVANGRPACVAQVRVSRAA